MRDFADGNGPRVRRLPAAGMVAIRGRFGEPAFSDALDACGVGVPGTRGIVASEAGQVLWMSPDELLVLCARDAQADLAKRLSRALEGLHHLVQAVGDMRARFAIEGPGAHVALAKLAPVDVLRFGNGEVRRTRLAQVSAAFWRTAPDAFELVCFRSVADYAEAALANAAAHVDGIALP